MVDQEYLRQHYTLLSDEALQDIKREDLVQSSAKREGDPNDPNAGATG